RPSFVGDRKCVTCHKAAAAFWKKTVHAHAWQTLVAGGKQNDYKCVSCHVTEEGLEEPRAVRTQVPASVCTACHTEQHSDTFQYEAYLRDILGAGHAP